MPDQTTAIFIKALRNRDAGKNVIEMADGTVYDFRDDGTGAQTAIVSNSDHIKRLLSITEGYEYHRPVMTMPAMGAGLALAPADLQPADLVPGTPYPANLAQAATVTTAGPDDAEWQEFQAWKAARNRGTIGGPVGDPEPAPVVIRVAADGSDTVTGDDTTDGGEGDGQTENKADQQDDAAKATEIPSDEALEAMDLEALQVLYKAVLGRKASPRYGVDVLRAHIATKRQP